VGPRCSFCGTTDGPFLDVEAGLRLLMCPSCQAARGHGTAPLGNTLARLGLATDQQCCSRFIGEPKRQARTGL
jgi:hypothetical protein